MIQRGKTMDSAAFPITRSGILPLHHKEPQIEELHIDFPIDNLLSWSALKSPTDCELTFRGIATTFKCLQKLTLTVEADTEENHCILYERFAEFGGRYMPTVLMDFTFKSPTYTTKSVGTPEGEKEMRIQDLCHLSSGCVFSSASQSKKQ